MEFYILDNSFSQIGVITAAESLLWYKRYNTVGEAEIAVECTTAMIELLRRGYYIYRYDDDMFCEIKTIEIKTDEEQGDQLIAKAQDISYILGERIVRWETVYSGTVVGFIRKLLNDNIINPAQAQRKISNFYFDESNYSEFTERIEVSAHTDTLLSLITSACQTAGYGFRISYERISGRLIFKMKKGTNKAVSDATPYVEFSPNYSNIKSTSYKKDDTNFKNIAYVGYKNSAGDTLLLSIHNESVEPTGNNRKEFFVDGSSTSRNITQQELLQLFPDLKEVCVTITEKKYKNYYTVVDGADQLVAVGTKESEEGEEKITVTDYCYIILIRNIGLNALTERVIQEEFNGTVETQDTFDYKTDYDLGDIVMVANEYGVSAEARIVEIVESEDSENNYAVEPIFKY